MEGDVFRAYVPVRKKALAEEGIALTSYGESEVTSVDDAIGLMLDQFGYATSLEVSKMSRASSKTAQRHLSTMVKQGFLIVEGTTRDRKYRKA